MVGAHLAGVCDLLPICYHAKGAGRTGGSHARLAFFAGVRPRSSRPILGDDDARPLIRHTLDAGTVFFDTAPMYSQDSSEVILGRALRDVAERANVVIAHEAAPSDMPRPERERAQPEGEHGRGGPLPAAARGRFIDLYQIPHHATGGAPGGAARSGQGG